jgi:protease IV
MFASMLGFILSIVVLFFFFIVIISAAVSSLGSEKVSIDNNSVLHFTLNEPIRERSSANPFDDIDFNSFKSKKQPGLNDILMELEKASLDPKIKGIYLDVPNVKGGMATLEEIRNALIKFKKSGKFIYSYADDYSQGSYYLASVSDKIFLNPQGIVTLNGLMTELMFFKGTLEKLEIQPQIIRHGKYKSAIETFILDKMSPENREQIAGFVDPIWNHLATNIAKARNLDVDAVKNMADSLEVRDADIALKLKLVDQLAYFDEFTAAVNAKTGNKSNEKINLVTLNKYNKTGDPVKKKYSKDRIAVIYATGEIGEGEGDENSIGSDGLSEAIRSARVDEKVKAIVLRVNSPGGSALASEVIWREVSLAKKVKPVIVSMGNVAASGGYYISCAADVIVAQPNTITGSIGVFGLLFNAQNMLKNKLGITVDTYKTGAYTDLGTITRSMSGSEVAIMQKSVDRVYDVFTSRVASGRHLSQEAVDSIGQGRVWSAIDAKRIGLVDEFGGLDDAIAIAAKKAGLSDYKIKTLPEQKNAMESLLEDLGGNAETMYMQHKLGTEYKYYNAAQEVLKLNGVQVRSFYSAEFN